MSRTSISNGQGSAILSKQEAKDMSTLKNAKTDLTFRV